MDKLTDLLASMPAPDSALDTTHQETTNDRSSSDIPVIPTPAVQNKWRKECPICYEPLGCPEAPSVPVKTICGHTFCWDCQYTWEASSDTCAMCRAPLHPKKPEVKPTIHMPPYESPIDERYPQHFDDFAPTTLGYSRDEEDTYGLQMALHMEAHARLHLYVEMVTCRSHADIDAPPFFAVYIPGNDLLRDKYDPPCEPLWGRGRSPSEHWTHERLIEMIKKYFGHLDSFKHPIIRYFCAWEFPDEDLVIGLYD